MSFINQSKRKFAFALFYTREKADLDVLTKGWQIPLLFYLDINNKGTDNGMVYKKKGRSV